METSPRLSFKGYKFSTALYRNKEHIKTLLALLTGFTTYLVGTEFEWKAFLVAAGVGFASLVGKFIYDALDYYFSEVELK